MSIPPIYPSLQSLLSAAPPAGLGPGPRAGVLAVDELNAMIDAALAEHRLPSWSEALVRALLLLWHDHHDAAHAIAQDDPSSEGSFLHAILHRREPDPSNAQYWIRRTCGSRHS